MTAEEYRASRLLAAKSAEERQLREQGRLAMADRLKEQAERVRDGGHRIFEPTESDRPGLSHPQRDARMLVGKYKGQKFRDLCVFEEGRSYLRWIAQQSDFPNLLKEMAAEWLR